MSFITRRIFIGGSAAIVALPSMGAAQTARQGQGLVFFTPEEARFVEAAIERLIPDEPEWAGARGADVLTYIDTQLAGPFGRGARLYLGGPFAQGEPTQGYQLPYSPADLYRRSIAAILSGGDEGRRFADAPAAERDAFLTRIEAGEADLDGVPSAVFFETLLANTIEGYFADPIYGGNKDMVAWRMVGFPGAHAGYLGVYTKHGLAYDEPPQSIGSMHNHGHGHGHGHGAQERQQPPQGGRR